MTRQLLKGIRVLDFTDFLAGPYCGMYLADMGADVIKVENLTTGGNFVRNARPLEKNSGLSMYFQNLNRNKRGVAINLKTEDGKKLFSELVKSADVLLENNRPGVMGRLGFSYEECKKLNPRLVYASISGFGQYGPNANRPGYDLIGQAMGGSMSITGWPGSEPTRAGMAIGDLFGGLNAGFAICASLYNREKTGVGNHIDVALVDSIFSGMEAKMMQYVYTGVSPVKTGNKYITSAPYDSFKAKDDYFVIASGTDKHFEKLSAAMGMPELAQDPLYCDTESRKKNADSLKEIIEKWTADKTVSEVCKIIDEAGIPVAPIYNCEQAANDKNIVEVREMLVNLALFVAGALLDNVAAITLLTPVLVPLISAYGIDKTFFGIIMIINLSIGQITPPIGMNLFVSSSICEVRLEKVIRQVLPFLAVLIVDLFLFTYIPGIVTVLPNALLH